MQADYYYNQFNSYDGRYNKKAGGGFIVLWIFLIWCFSLDIHYVNNSRAVLTGNF
jgi:hypothetical protein